MVSTTARAALFIKNLPLKSLYIYLSKLLPLVVLPVGIVVILLSLALVLIVRSKRKASATALIMALLVLWVSSMPIVASTLYRKLEQDYPPVALADISNGDCIVLLGGVIGPALPPRVDIELSETIDRVYKAAELYRAGKGRMVIVAAGNQPWSPTDQPEAELARDLLMEWGVPASAIMLDGASRNTRENAVNSKVLIEKLGCEMPLLVTSAAHMLRSVGAFKKVGVEVFPVSTDVRAISRD